MRTLVTRSVAPATCLALVFSLVSAPVLAAGPQGRLEGMVLDLDGRPAPGFRVHLIDARGSAVDRTATGSDGVYTFAGLENGAYALGVENPSGQVAPLSGPAIEVADGQLVRRDVKLLQADATTRANAIGANYGLGAWWGGLSAAAKAWTVIAVIAVAGVTASALDDDNDEPQSTATVPGI